LAGVGEDEFRLPNHAELPPELWQTLCEWFALAAGGGLTMVSYTFALQLISATYHAIGIGLNLAVCVVIAYAALAFGGMAGAS
jgi:hypothetical protein